MASKKPNLRFANLGTGPGRTTNTYNVLSVRGETPLGIIKYHAHWRQYVFRPNNHCIFADDCLLEVSEFLSQLKEERKNVAKKSG